MKIELVLGYLHKEDVKVLFSEYTSMLIIGYITILTKCSAYV